ncbi:MAG: TPM domain-containing protein [Caulobacteraceae bacterium]
MARFRPFAGVAAFAALLFAASLALAADLDFPRLSGRVVDDAGVLSAQTEADLSRKLEDLENKTHRQLVVVTLRSLQGREIEDYGYQLGREWRIGRAGVNDGALFIIAPNDRQVRVEVGYGLEGVLTDALSSVILQTKVLPAFRTGNVEKGVIDGTDALIEQLALPDDQARAAVADASSRSRTAGNAPWWAILLGFVIIWGLRMMLFGSYRRRGAIFPLFVIGALTYGDRIAGRRAWDDPRGPNDRWGGGGSFGGGGGGFSGGGGSFGGGGASGRW